MLKYDDYIHCFTFLDYLTPIILLNTVSFLLKLFSCLSFVMPDPFFVSYLFMSTDHIYEYNDPIATG